MHCFSTKFGSKQVERASQNAFDDVVIQASKHDGKLGSIFCQLQRDSSSLRLKLTGTYLPPEWSDKINKVLQDYKEELQLDEDIPF